MRRTIPYDDRRLAADCRDSGPFVLGSGGRWVLTKRGPMLEEFLSPDPDSDYGDLAIDWAKVARQAVEAKVIDTEEAEILLLRLNDRLYRNEILDRATTQQERHRL